MCLFRCRLNASSANQCNSRSQSSLVLALFRSLLLFEVLSYGCSLFSCLWRCTRECCKKWSGLQTNPCCSSRDAVVFLTCHVEDGPCFPLLQEWGLSACTCKDAYQLQCLLRDFWTIQLCHAYGSSCGRVLKYLKQRQLVMSNENCRLHRDEACILKPV